MCETTAKSLWPSPASVEGISEHQRGALEVSLSKRVGMLVGSPGTGKTHSTAAVIRQICAQHGSDCVAVAAPTGKAAVRITSFLHTWGIAIEATTIHRLLEVSRNGHDGKGWGFQRSRDFPLSKRFVIVDETSMVDVSLMSSLLEACASGTHVLFVGDKSQLPPVGSGAPLRDFINSGRIPCGELTEIKRNAGLIVHACAKMKDGKPIETAEKIDLAAGQNLHHIETETAEESIEVLRTILAQLRAGDRFDPVWECQVLVAVNAKSQLSRKELNSILQADLNPTGGGATENPFRVRDKVICLKNDSLPISRYQKLRGPETDPAAYLESEDEEFIANGEIGRVLAVAPKLAVMKFSLPDRVYKIHLGKSKDEEEGSKSDDPSKGIAGNFDLAFCVTVHRMQGSEAPVVICLVDDYPGAKMVCERTWWYTAISRAKQLCVIVGKRSVMQQHCKKVGLNRRKTFLKELLERKE